MASDSTLYRVLTNELTSDPLTVLWELRPGNAGANTIDDHLEVLDAAMSQPPRRRRHRAPPW